MAAKPTAVPELMETVNDTLESAGVTAERIINSLPIWLSKLMLAALAILLGALLIRLGRRLINRLVLGRKGANVKSPGQRETLRSLLISVFNYTMYFILITIALGIFGVNVTSMIAVAGVGGIAIGFGAQTLVKDVISGIFLWVEGNITVGDTQVTLETLDEDRALDPVVLDLVNGRRDCDSSHRTLLTC